MKKLVLALLLILSLLMEGCWSRREIEDMAMVTGMGIDTVKVAGKEKFLITFQIIRGTGGPGGMGGGVGGGGVGPGTMVTQAFWVTSSIGDNLADAVVNLSTRSPRKVDLAHMEVVVLGRKVAEEKVPEVVDFLQRERTIRLRTWVVVAEGEARDVVTSQPELERSLFKGINSLIFNRKDVSKTEVVDLKDFLIALADPGREPVTGVIRVFRPPEIKKMASQAATGQAAKVVRLHGGAVFARGRLVDFWDDRITRGYLWTQSKAERGIITLSLPGFSRPVALKIRGSLARIRPEIKNGELKIKIRVRVQGDINDNQNPGAKIADIRVIKGLEKEYARAVKDEIAAALRRAQEKKSDVFGFGEAVHRHLPAVWRQVEKDWPEVFAELPVEIEVKAAIKHAGLADNTIKIK